jgi:hypothetical protein
MAVSRTTSPITGGLVASVTHIPLKTTSSVIIKAAGGMDLGVSKLI